MSRRLYLFSSSIERDVISLERVSSIPHGITGIGLIEAAVGTVKLIDDFDPTEIIFLGTCGAYPKSGLEVGEIVAGGTVQVGSGESFSGQARIPTIIPTEVFCDSDLTNSIAPSLKQVPVLCTLGVTEDDELSSNLSSIAHVENLELFSVIRGAGSIPVCGILGITNRVGSGGGKEWRENFHTMMNKVFELAVSGAGSKF